MVKKGIVLSHKILWDGIQVDQEKFEVISKFNLPISMRGVRSFLGLAGFY